MSTPEAQQAPFSADLVPFPVTDRLPGRTYRIGPNVADIAMQVGDRWLHVTRVRYVDEATVHGWQEVSVDPVSVHSPSNPHQSSSDQEVWADIPGHSGYQASTFGRIRSVDRVIVRRNGSPLRCRGKILSPAPLEGGHLSVNAGHNRSRLAHHLVLETFVGPRPDGMEGCHWDGNPQNNRLDNLRWDTPSANQLDKLRHGTHNMASRTTCRYKHLLQEPNITASGRREGRRNCLACSRARPIHRNLRLQGLPSSFKALADAKYAEIMGLEVAA